MLARPLISLELRYAWFAPNYVSPQYLSNDVVWHARENAGTLPVLVTLHNNYALIH
jgi:hypothetical protein